MPDNPTRNRRRHWMARLAFLAGFGLAGCGLGTSGPPGPDFDRGQVPDLRGARVLVLPPQIVQGGHADLESELAFALREGRSDVEWILPEALRSRMERSPELRFALDRLDVGAFRYGAVDRIGDPLYGHLYQLGVIESADFALLPVEIREREASGTAPSSVRLEVLAALVQVRTGRVLWSGMSSGDPGPAGSLSATATAVDALVRRLAR